jgi:hypothetical protein
MWGTTSNFPNINSYNEAKSEYHSIKPLRGHDNLRPLCRRSKDSKAFIRMAGDDVIIKLYRTDIITYKPDGAIHLNSGGYASTTTAQAISDMSPFACWTKRDTLIVARRDEDTRYLEKDTPRFVLPGTGLIFKPNAVEPVNPVVATAVRKRVDKDRAKKLREFFAGVDDMCVAFQSAFQGGAAPERELFKVRRNWGFEEEAGRVVSERYLLSSDLPLTEEERVAAAWAMVSVRAEWLGGGNFAHIIEAPTKNSKANFWRRIYKGCDAMLVVHEDLPIGKVEG